MSQNSERIAAELVDLCYIPGPFTAPKQQGGAAGVRFDYRIEDGSRAGDTVTLAIAIHNKEGEWPEVAPHWVYVPPPDEVLAEQVRGSQPPGAVEICQCSEEHDWLAISAPPSDFWDQIDTPGGKNTPIEHRGAT